MGVERPTRTDAKVENADRRSPSDKPSSPPPDNPGAPGQPSRIESRARSRELAQQEKQVEAKDPGAPPAEDRDHEPASTEPKSEGQDAGKSETGQAAPQDEREEEAPTGTDTPVTPGEEPDHPQAVETPNDFDRRIRGDGPPDDDGRMAEVDEDERERGISDRLKQMAAKLDFSDRRKELAGAVDRPDFQDPEGDPSLVPDRYGTPLDRADGSRVPLFNGEPAREQTQQGTLGDCGVMSTLGAVAGHNPQAIHDCVRETDAGNYEVRLHEAKYSPPNQRYEPTGRPIALTVTPELPIKDQKPDSPVFAETTSANVAWSPVLEKAIAGVDQTWNGRRRDRATELWNLWGKAGGAPTGYVRLNQGTNPGERAELLTQLTGQPAKTVQFPTGNDKQGRSADRQLKEEIAGQLSQSKPILVGTRKLLDGESDLPRNLVASHAYEVTKVDEQGKFHLRNPWNYEHPEPLTFQEFKAHIRPRYTTLD
ncbi:hypothetical protein E1293_11765 [Actinomadura darangshiensis]|uniref:Calpain catalytic domain-containing protein n=1 Tax=Actinomadura darangshiensis TaxID=705336 RepID=A0A4V2YWE5_9ACTN|nr:C2 family cysteine protease [Actinomadura darangshiensis]TDD85117.1 hypothetical protein E1293_11765 [Actinomadura darangshiensis]